MSDNKIEYGIENVHIFPITTDTVDNIEYGEVIRIPGASKITLEPQGEGTTIYADNSVYVQVSSNNGYAGDLELYTFTEKFRTKILNEIKDSKGVMIEKADAKVKGFALAFQFIGDVNDARVLLPYCSMSSRPKEEKTTKGEGLEASPSAMPILASPRPTDKVVRMKIYQSDDAATYNNWFTAPYEPTITPPIGG